MLRFNYSPPTTVGKESELTDEDLEAGGRPVFEDVAGHVGSLDQELAASGFTKQNQEVLKQFVENAGVNDEDLQDDTSSENEDVEDPDCNYLEQLTVSNDEVSSAVSTLPIAADDDEDGEKRPDGESQDNESEEGQASNRQDPEKLKRLEKQRKRVVKSVRSGVQHRGTRNASKDKGGRRSRHFSSDF